MAKYYFLTLISVSLFCSVAYSVNCTIPTSSSPCDDCTAIAGCGWCAPTEQCIEGTADGPNSSICAGPAWNFQKCTPCQNYLTCHTCLAHDSDCVYCPGANNGLGGCRPIGFVGCPGGIARGGCPCSSFGVCSDCIDSGANGDCTWCEATHSCQTNSTCPPGPSFNQTTGCSCDANKDCQSCNANGCDWCSTGQCTAQGACSGPVMTNCNNFCDAVSGTCEGCTAQQGCGWCSQTKTCVDTQSNPCKSSSTCPVCNAASYCDLCGLIDGCVWCDDARSCQPSPNNTCLKTMTCSSFCEETTSCDACNTQRGCTWCGNTKTCEDASTITDCMWTHTCSSPPTPVVSPPSRKFDGAAFVGGMFLVIGIAVLAAAAYFFYRWKTGKRIEYRQM